MLKKNVYICFVAGYHGNFVNWAINASDSHTRTTTITNPINYNYSKQFGGSGTSHYHQRHPTHLGPSDLLGWILLKRPTQPQTYVVNIFSAQTSEFFKSILSFDPDPEFIIIHHGNNYDNWCYGVINNLLKWPTMLEAVTSRIDLKLNFDPFSCYHSMTLRNFMGMSEPTLNILLERHLYPPEQSDLVRDFDAYHRWYHCRSKLQPHEVNLDNFLIWDEFPWNKIHQFNLIDIPNKNFPDLLNEFMLSSGCSDDFDVTPVRAVMDEYIDLQHNLQWFSSIDSWRRYGKLDEFLQGHMLVQGFVLKEMFFNNDQFVTVLPDWHQKSLCEINEIYQKTKNQIKVGIPAIPSIYS
jgi:hypothetical protein